MSNTTTCPTTNTFIRVIAQSTNDPTKIMDIDKKHDIVLDVLNIDKFDLSWKITCLSVNTKFAEDYKKRISENGKEGECKIIIDGKIFYDHNNIPPLNTIKHINAYCSISEKSSTNNIIWIVIIVIIVISLCLGVLSYYVFSNKTDTSSKESFNIGE